MAFTRKTAVRGNLDATDRMLLALLQHDSQARYADLGKQLHLSPPAVHERVQKLRRSGVIKNYTIEIDPSSLEFDICAFVNVHLTCTTSVAIAPLLKPFPQIEECHSVAGEQCMILKVRTETPKTLEHLLTDLRQVPGIERTTTVMVLETYFDRGPRTQID
jgi:Lrp/AsnC family leucine-responsive transcriptional regulator